MVSSSLVYHAGKANPPQPNPRTQQNCPKALVIAAIIDFVVAVTRSTYTNLVGWWCDYLVWRNAC